MPPARWPDFREFVAIGYFLIGWRVLEIVAAFPKLLDNSAFMLIVGSTLGAGGLGLVGTFLFAASKGAADANRRADDALKVAAKDDK